MVLLYGDGSIGNVIGTWFILLCALIVCGMLVFIVGCVVREIADAIKEKGE